MRNIVYLLGAMIGAPALAAFALSLALHYLPARHHCPVQYGPNGNYFENCSLKP